MPRSLIIVPISVFLGRQLMCGHKQVITLCDSVYFMLIANIKKPQPPQKQYTLHDWRVSVWPATCIYVYYITHPCSMHFLFNSWSTASGSEFMSALMVKSYRCAGICGMGERGGDVIRHWFTLLS